MQNDDATVGLPQVFQPGQTIAKRYRGDQRDAYLYDANSDLRIRLASLSVTQGIGCEGARKVRGLDGFWIACGNLGFIYKPGYEIQRVTLDEGYFRSFLYATNEGALVYGLRGEVWRRSAGGQRRRLWPSP